MSQDEQKRLAAQAALDFIESGDIVGVGTGSTTNFFIDALAGVKGKIDGVVSSSQASADRLKAIGLPIMDLNRTGDLSLYVDGADEATAHLQLIKGGGGALTREKIVASASKRFVCIVDESKLSDHLGSFPLPVEVIPMAQSLVGRKLIAMGGQPRIYIAQTYAQTGVLAIAWSPLSVGIKLKQVFFFQRIFKKPAPQMQALGMPSQNVRLKRDGEC